MFRRVWIHAAESNTDGDDDGAERAVGALRQTARDPRMVAHAVDREHVEWHVDAPGFHRCDASRRGERSRTAKCPDMSHRDTRDYYDEKPLI